MPLLPAGRRRRRIGQLLAAGLTRARSRAGRAGALHPLQRGVYAVGHRDLAVRGRRWAAVLAYAPDGVSAIVALRRRTVRNRRRAFTSRRPGGRRPRTGSGSIAAVAGRESRDSTACRVTTRLALLACSRCGRAPAPRLSTAISRAGSSACSSFADLDALLRRHPIASVPLLLAQRSPLCRAARSTRSELQDLIAELCDAPPPERWSTTSSSRAAATSRPARRLVVEGRLFDLRTAPRSP